MEPIVCRLVGIPEELSTYGDYSAFLFSFKAVPQSRRGKPDELDSEFEFFVELEVSGRLPNPALWNKLSSGDRMKLYFAFVRERLRQSPPQKHQGKGDEAETLPISLNAQSSFNPAAYAPQNIEPKKEFILVPNIGPIGPIGLSKV